MLTNSGDRRRTDKRMDNNDSHVFLFSIGTNLRFRPLQLLDIMEQEIKVLCLYITRVRLVLYPL